MKGFKSFCSALATLDGIEVAHMIRKQQFETSAHCRKVSLTLSKTFTDYVGTALYKQLS